MRLLLPFVAIAALHCSPEPDPKSPSDDAPPPKPVAPSPTAPAPTAPAPAPSPDPAPDPAPAPQKGATLELRLESATVKAGQPIKMKLVNVGDAAWSFAHPGASNGCGAFRWNVSLSNPKRRYVDPSNAPMRMCTMAIVPPSTITVNPGQEVDVSYDTESAYRDTATPSANPERVAPGTYDVFVTGGTTTMKQSVTIEK